MFLFLFIHGIYAQLFSTYFCALLLQHWMALCYNKGENKQIRSNGLDIPKQRSTACVRCGLTCTCYASISDRGVKTLKTCLDVLVLEQLFVRTVASHWCWKVGFIGPRLDSAKHVSIVHHGFGGANGAFGSHTESLLSFFANRLAENAEKQAPYRCMENVLRAVDASNASNTHFSVVLEATATSSHPSAFCIASRILFAMLAVLMMPHFTAWVMVESLLRTRKTRENWENQSMKKVSRSTERFVA